jgi:AraC-like DNA-binding protein
VGSEAETFTRFRDDLDRTFARTRRVEDYADRLGCCVRTLTRASLAATGRSAKQVIDDRVTLEAKRLLAGTDLPVAEVGRRLGFPEPTNFGRFFQREAGQSPGAFRATTTDDQRATAAEERATPAGDEAASSAAGEPARASVPAPRPPLDPVPGFVQA